MESSGKPTPGGTLFLGCSDKSIDFEEEELSPPSPNPKYGLACLLGVGRSNGAAIPCAIEPCLP